MPKKKQSKNGKQKVRIRTYRHGLGDCHLLSFTKPGGSKFHMLIDCGVVNRTQNPGPLMTKVAQDVRTQTNGVLDVVVATHQHTDHLSGFKQAESVFGNAIQMKRLWLAWTEDPKNPLGKEIQHELVNKLAAVQEAARQLSALHKKAAEPIEAVLNFFGLAAAGDSSTQAILDSLQNRPETKVRYYNPGDGFVLDEVPNVRVYVLGPPTDPAQLKITNPRASKREGYEFAGIAASANGLVDALEAAAKPRKAENNQTQSDNDGPDPELSYPFEDSFRRDEAGMKDNDFFQKHYFGKDDRGQDQEWRQIPLDWLESVFGLALALNDFTNNTSLALAFEFIDSGEVLLLPGDAQIGSWLTWDKLVWNVTDSKGTKREVRLKDLFPRVVYYKGSHHASHNGTLSGYVEGLGLEEMTNPNLVCVVPVDRAMSKEMGWDRTLPWDPLLKRLGEKTRGRLILTDRAVPPPTADSLDASLSKAEKQRFTKQVVVTDDYVDYML